MAREIGTATPSGGLYVPPGRTARGAPAKSFLHLAVLVAAAMPLLALVAWATLGWLRGEARVPAAPHPLAIHTAAIHTLRAPTIPSPKPPPDAFALESRLPPAQLMNRWKADITRASRRFGVPETWLRSVMEAESGGRTMQAAGRPITSVAGAVGVMQLMPETYAEMRGEYGLGRDPYEPHDNIIAAAAYLRWLFGRYGYPTMFAAYNDGPGNLEQRLIDGRMLPLETQLYVASITGSGAVVRVGGRSIAKFTRPDGTEVDINGFAVNSVRAPLPGEYTPGVNAVIGMGKLRQGVRETVAQATAELRRRGGRV